MKLDKYFAPVIIPTLNRYEHLKKCIDSLKNNTYAKETELFISVDFPPSEKYKEGYQKILQYVNSIDGFKKLNIFIQEKNLGANDNYFFLVNKVFETYDYFIYSEDDNVFSPNFLEYINTCLEYTSKDEKAYAVCGYSFPIEWGDKTGLIRENICFSAWGYGMWKNQYIRSLQLKRKDVFQYFRKLSNIKKIYCVNKSMFEHAVYIAAGKHYIALDENKEIISLDITKGIYMYMNDMYVLMPALSKVRNEGHDGSGLNCDDSNKDIYFNQEIDTKSNFTMEDCKVVAMNSTMNQGLDLHFGRSRMAMLKTWIIWVLYVFIGYKNKDMK